MTDRRLEEALRHLNPPPGTKLWHGGASVLGALRGLSPEVAAWRPSPDRHSIWALALHVAYWNYAVRRRITGDERGGFPRSPSNFPTVPSKTTKAAWKEDRELVKGQHDLLVGAIERFDPSRLDEHAGSETKTTYADLITGIVLHDTYHAGQIVMLKRLAASLAKRTALILCAAMLTVLPDASAQTFVGAAFQQAFTSTSTLESPRGLSLTVGKDRILGPVGLSLDYHRVSQGSGVVNQTCGIFSCLVGPFDQSHTLQTVALGLSLQPFDNSLAVFTLGANVSLSSQSERLQHVDTGEIRNQNGVGPDVGIGLSTRVEFPVKHQLHPFLAAQYDRILASPCDADAACLPSRNVTRLDIGVLWRP